MNLLLFSPHQYGDDGNVRIEGRQLRHLTETLKVSVGDSIQVGEIGGQTGLGKVVRLDGNYADLEISLTQAPPEPLPLTLVLALPRPKMMRRIFQTVASLGVKELHLINSYRVEKSYWQTPWLSEAAMREQLLLGLEQCRDTVVPSVYQHKRFKPFVEDELGAIVGDNDALVAHPVAAQPCPVDHPSPITLAIGPEGGFIPYEVDKLAEQGFQAVAVGERILRVETAIPVILSRLFPR